MSAARLTIVHTESSVGWGGQELRILSESAGMIERGHSVTIVCPEEARIFQEAKERDIPVMALPIARKNLHGLLALRTWLKAHQLDLLNTHSSTDSWLTALACASLHRAPPIVRTRHISTAIANNVGTHWLYQYAAIHVVTTGERLREQLIAENGFDASRITSVPTGIDPRLFAPSDRAVARSAVGLPIDVPLIGIVATLRNWKGHEYLLEAMAQLPRRDAHLVIVGDGPRRKQIEQRIDALALRDRVHLPGNQRNVAPWLQALDVFVLPSYANAGVPQAIVQAMLTGLPIVSTGVGSIGEAIRDGETGIVVPSRDARALSMAIAALLDDAPRAMSLGAAARARAIEHFSLDTMLDRMEAVFHAALDRARQRTPSRLPRR